MSIDLRPAVLIIALATLVITGYGGVHAATAPGAPASPPPVVVPTVSSPTTSVPGVSDLNGSANSAPAWANVSASAGNPPAPRSYGRSFAYDPADGYDVLFGGYGSSGQYLADTWTFHAGTWTQLSPSTHPSARDHSTLAWDPVDGYLLLFGGSGTGGAYSDTWTFLGGQWSQLSPTIHPSARWASSMTWDGADQEMLLFGGCVAGTAAGDTWTFLHGNWTQLSPHPAPSGRENVALQFDARDNYTVLFGGDDYYAAFDGDTWEFSAGNWTQLHPAVAPSPRSEAGFAFDPSLGSLVLFGGSSTSDLGDTWEFSGGTWTQAYPDRSPDPRVFPILTDDPADSELVLFAGVGSASFDDTWVYYTFHLNSSQTASDGNAPLPVEFSATVSGAIGPIEYRWNLGDGNTSGNASPNETYELPGLYFPTLTVTDSSGATATVYLEVRARAPLVTTAVGGPNRGVAPFVVEFSAASTGGTPPYWYWWTSTSGGSSDLNSTSFTFDTAGSYVVRLVANDSGTSHQYQNFSVTVTAPVVPPLTAQLFGDPATGEAPLPVAFQSFADGGVPPYTYAWSFGDGSDGTGPSANHTYTAGGVYTATAEVTDSANQTVVRSTTVTVVPPVSVNASVTPSTGTAPMSAGFEAVTTGGVGPYAFTWSLGDGSTSASASFNHSYPIAGSYPVSVVVTDANGHRAGWNSTVVVGAATPISMPPGTNTPAASAPANDQLIVLVGEVVVGAVAIAAIIVFVTRSRR